MVRLLDPADAGALYALRLEALRTDPDGFLTTVDEEERRTVDDFADRLRDRARDPACAVFGAFSGEALVGMVGSVRGRHAREQHKAVIWGLWVAPAARRRGLARALMAAALDHLRSAGGVEQVQLGITTGQQAARALYSSLGFVPFGLERQAMKDGDRYLDEEHMVCRLD